MGATIAKIAQFILNAYGARLIITPNMEDTIGTIKR